MDVGLCLGFPPMLLSYVGLRDVGTIDAKDVGNLGSGVFGALDLESRARGRSDYGVCFAHPG